MRFIINIIIFILLLSAPLCAQNATSIKPLESEKLDNIIILDCGLKVQEINGYISVKSLNRMCTYAYSNFFKFSKAKGLKINHRQKFNWNASFIPEGSCYRCLNDLKFRFRDRQIKTPVVGYTYDIGSYLFVFSDSNDPIFSQIFVHELFHSFSMFYGVFENHKGSLVDKRNTDEELAEEFTSWLGYN